MRVGLYFADVVAENKAMGFSAWQKVKQAFDPMDARADRHEQVFVPDQPAPQASPSTPALDPVTLAQRQAAIEAKYRAIEQARAQQAAQSAPQPEWQAQGYRKY